MLYTYFASLKKNDFGDILSGIWELFQLCSGDSFSETMLGTKLFRESNLGLLNAQACAHMFSCVLAHLGLLLVVLRGLSWLGVYISGGPRRPHVMLGFEPSLQSHAS